LWKNLTVSFPKQNDICCLLLYRNYEV